MPTVQNESTVSSEKLIQEVSRLSGPALDTFLDQVLMLRAERRAPHLSDEEADLLLKIDTPIS